MIFSVLNPQSGSWASFASFLSTLIAVTHRNELASLSLIIFWMDQESDWSKLGQSPSFSLISFGLGKGSCINVFLMSTLMKWGKFGKGSWLSRYLKGSLAYIDNANNDNSNNNEKFRLLRICLSLHCVRWLTFWSSLKPQNPMRSYYQSYFIEEKVERLNNSPKISRDCL